MISQIVALLLLCTAYSSAWGLSTRTESWSEDVALHDGRVIKVAREVDYTFQFLAGDSGSPVFMKSWPDKFWLKFTHPDTQKTIKWQGKQYFDPVLLDIVDGVAYLVVYGRPDKSTERIYGCPELPYIFLKYEGGSFGKWTPIPAEQAPGILQDANLSPSYPDFPQHMDQHNETMHQIYEGRPSRYLSRDEVLANIRKVERSSGGGVQAKIPRSYDDWHTVYKNSFRNERIRGDCRLPPQPPPDIPLPKPTDIDLDIIGSRDYILKYPEDFPDKSRSEVIGTITRGQCAPLFKIADPENIMLGELFVKDHTGIKKLPYTGPIPFPSGRMLEKRTERHCNSEFVWFVAGQEDRDKTVVTKYTASGDFVYSVRFQNPATAENKMHRSMILDSLTVENDYFIFHWWQDLPTIQGPPAIYSHRITKLRFKEPDKPIPSINSDAAR